MRTSTRWTPPKLDRRRSNGEPMCKLCSAKPVFVMRYLSQSGEVAEPASDDEVRLAQRHQARSWGAWLPEWACSAHVLRVRDMVGGMDVTDISARPKKPAADAGGQQRWPW